MAFVLGGTLLLTGNAWSSDGRIEIPSSGFSSTISTSGSYVVTRNFVDVWIAVNDVSIDLNGFFASIRSAPGVGSTIVRNGTAGRLELGPGSIVESVTSSMIVCGWCIIRNTTVTGALEHGILAKDGTVLVVDTVVKQSDLSGIRSPGGHPNGLLARNVIAAENGNTGISCDQNCLIDGANLDENRLILGNCAVAMDSTIRQSTWPESMVLTTTPAGAYSGMTISSGAGNVAFDFERGKRLHPSICNGLVDCPCIAPNCFQ